VKQLRGFQRVSLDPGQKLTVEFTLTPDDLSLIDFNMNKVVEPGVFDVMVGSSSADTSSVPLEVVN
jgi:beta-glucosidase